MDEHVEFKDSYQDLEAKADDIAHSLSKLPIDYKLADRCAEIEFSVEDIKEWYEDKKRELINFEKSYQYERRLMEAKVIRLNEKLKNFNNVVQSLKLQEFSRGQHGGSYSRLSPYLHQ